MPRQVHTYLLNLLERHGARPGMYGVEKLRTSWQKIAGAIWWSFADPEWVNSALRNAMRRTANLGGGMFHSYAFINAQTCIHR